MKSKFIKIFATDTDSLNQIRLRCDFIEDNGEVFATNSYNLTIEQPQKISVSFHKQTEQNISIGLALLNKN